MSLVAERRRILRVFFSLLVLLTASLLVWTYYIYATPQNWDEVFHVRTSLVSPSDFSTGVKFRYSIDHPSIKRHVYGWVLHAIGVHEMSVPDVDYTKNKEWNLERGRVPPLDVSIALRFTNAAFMAGALVLIFLTGLVVLRNAYLSLLVPVGLILSRRVAEGAVAYLGCDAILAFFVALTLFVWVLLAERGKASSLYGAAIIAAVAGLALSSKLNGGLVIISYCLYLAIVNRGAKRFTMPLLAAAVCVAVFVALNPVMWGGPTWTPAGAVRAMFRHRENIWLSQYSERPMPRMWLVTVFFPYAAFLPAFVAIAVFLRKEKWVLPVCIWAAVLVAGTLASVNRTYARYYVPIDMATFTAAGLLGWSLVKRPRSEGAGKASPAAKRGGRGAAILKAAAASLLLLTFVAAYEPFGPFRVHSERSVVQKVRLFYRQGLAYYGLIESLDGQAVRAELTALTREQSRQAQPERERPGIGPVRTLSGLAFAAACALVLVLGYRYGGWLAGGALFGVLVWMEFSRGAYYLQSTEDRYFTFLAVMLLFGWIDLARGSGPLGRRQAAALGVACGMCTAASGFGIVLTGLTILVVLRREGAKAAHALWVMFVAAAVFAVVEPAFCYLGARGPVAFVRGTILASVDFWPARGAGTEGFLMPFEYYFPWLALLPLGAGALLAAKGESWTAPVALWAGAIVLTTLATRPATLYYAPADVNFALLLGAGLPALAILRDAFEARATAAGAAPAGAEDG